MAFIKVIKNPGEETGSFKPFMVESSEVLLMPPRGICSTVQLNLAHGRKAHSGFSSNEIARDVKRGIVNTLLNDPDNHFLSLNLGGVLNVGRARFVTTDTEYGRSVKYLLVVVFDDGSSQTLKYNTQEDCLNWLGVISKALPER